MGRWAIHDVPPICKFGWLPLILHHSSKYNSITFTQFNIGTWLSAAKLEGSDIEYEFIWSYSA